MGMSSLIQHRQQFSITKALFKLTGSIVAMTMLMRTISQELTPYGFNLKALTKQALYKVFSNLSPQLTMVIEEVEHRSINHVYMAAETYLRSKTIPSSTMRFKVSKTQQEDDYSLTREKREEIFDTFQGVQFRWRYKTKGTLTKIKYFELSFHKKHKEMALDTYLPHILTVAKAIQEENRAVRLYSVITNDSKNPWSSVKLNHPTTFDKLAMDNSLKKTIMDDLDTFVNRKEFYDRVGKAWKRGYLLYGPPGTGKSSLIAAMANYLKFDVYDLELTDVKRNSQLKRLLLYTKIRSILVVEDIDYSLDFQNSKQDSKEKDRISEAPSQLTLSGMLNFIDGLWSTFGDTRIIVFTTNNKERLDPALLRPGRMDVHIHMSYCTPCGFRTLASTYLQICDHPAFEEIEGLLGTKNLTPAEIAGELMKNNDPDVALEKLIEFIKEK